MKRRFVRKISAETHAELERVVELKLKIPTYREIAARDGTSARYICQLISQMIRERRRSIENDVCASST
jgi:hypothetical protein